MGNYYGIKGIKFIWHNEWADPEIEYLGVKVNEPTVTNTMLERWIHDDNDNLIPEREKDEDGFCKYMKANAYEVRELIKLAMEPIGVKTECNWGGVGILAIENGIDDYIISGENYGDGWTCINKAKVRYNVDGTPYFIRYGKRYRLDEFMKV